VDAVKGLADRGLRYPDSPFDPRNRRVSVLVMLDRAVGGTEIPMDSVRARLGARQ
jgi:hypothetical protein